MSTPSVTPALAALVGLRSAPALDAAECRRLREELATALAACEWFTIGVMAPDSAAAVTALRECERAFHWQPLRADATASADAGPVFLKGNQRTGQYLLRQEAGLGEGILITGHSAADPAAEGTWGPLPLDLFAAAG